MSSITNLLNQAKLFNKLRGDSCVITEDEYSCSVRRKSKHTFDEGV